jgi:hypothetical protein
MSSIAPSHPGAAAARMLAAPRVRRPSRLLLAFLVLLGMAPPAYLLQTGGALTTGYEIQKLERERTIWLNRNQQLEVEIARAQSLAWVEHEAVYRLGMQRPPQTVVIQVNTPVPAPPEPRLLRRGGEPMPAVPIEEGPSWMDALDFLAATLGRGN